MLSFLRNIVTKISREPSKKRDTEELKAILASAGPYSTTVIKREPNETVIAAFPSSAYSRRLERKIDRSAFSLITRRDNTGTSGKITMLPDYDFAHVERYYEKEGLVRRFVTTAVAKALRADLSIGPNEDYTGSKPEEAYRHFQKVYSEVIRNSKTTHTALVQTILRDLYLYGNSFVIKRRTKNVISSLLVEDPLKIFVVRDEHTNLPLEYIRNNYLRPKPHSESIAKGVFPHKNLFPKLTQNAYGTRMQLAQYGYYGPSLGPTETTERYTYNDLVHFVYMPEHNAAYGMPPAMPSIQDIEHLRTLEESLILLGWQYGNPILLVKIDTTGMTQVEAEAEADRVSRALTDMNSVGYLLASHRLTLELKYPSGSNVPLEKFVEHMTRRSMYSLDIPRLLMGDGENAGRQSGEAIEAITSDMVMMVVRIFAETFEQRIIADLCESIGIGSIGDCPAKIVVREIDRRLFNAKISQLTNLANVGIIPPSRVLKELDMTQNTPEEEEEITKHIARRAGKQVPEGSIVPTNQYGKSSLGSTMT